MSSDPKAWVLLAIPVLLPFGAAAELPVLVAAVWMLLTLHRVEWSAPAPRLAVLLFGAYWLPELFSAPDSYDAGKSWLEVAVDLRFGLLLLFATQVRFDVSTGAWDSTGSPRTGATQRFVVSTGVGATPRFVCAGIALLLVAWCVDALVQAATGYSLGGAARADRLSGIFGDDNLKLGGVVAVLAPFALLWAWPPRHSRESGNPGAVRFAYARLLLMFALVLSVVLLAGARAAWIALAVVIACIAWRRLGAKRGSAALAALLVLAIGAGLIANASSPRFAERMDRTAAALRGDGAALDYALSFRLPIWRTALQMIAAHPLNGIGVRAFREAYDDFAPPDDHWLDPNHGSGALHAHQFVLEVMSETGLAGLTFWLAGLAAALNAWRRASPAARERAAAPAYALVAMLFPFNTHYAVYSTFWSTLLFAMLALWIGALHARDDTP